MSLSAGQELDPSTSQHYQSLLEVGRDRQLGKDVPIRPDMRLTVLVGDNEPSIKRGFQGSALRSSRVDAFEQGLGPVQEPVRIRIGIVHESDYLRGGPRAALHKADPDMVSMNPVLDLPLRGPVRKMTPDLLFQRGSRLSGQPYRGRDGHQHRLAIRHGPVQSSLQTSNKPERYPVEPQARLRVSAPVACSLDGDDFDRNALRGDRDI